MQIAHRWLLRSATALLAWVTCAALATFVAPVGRVAADDKVVMGGGAGIVVDEDTLCTLTAIGHDKTGALIGFTSARDPKATASSATWWPATMAWTTR